MLPGSTDGDGAIMARAHSAHADYSLADVRIFVGLSDAALERIKRHCVLHRYQPGASVVGYLESSSDVFFIVSGEVRVAIYSLSGKVVSFRELGPGEIFGEYPAIDGGPRSASVEARTSSLIASMSSTAFIDVLETEPKVSQALLPSLVTRIRALTTRVYEFSTLAVNNRIQAELLRLAKIAGTQGNSARITPPPTHAEIAARVSTSREAVSRELARLSRIGVIEREGRALLITDFNRLVDMVHEATGE